MTISARLLFPGVLAVLCLRTAQPEEVHGREEYGVDISFPMHYHQIKKEEFPLGSHKQSFYDDFIEGCHQFFGEKDGERCDWCENDRISMNLNQPSEMLNFTTAGFAKIRQPEEVREYLTKFWEDNKDKGYEEDWPKGNTYTNQWVTKTSMIPLEDRNMVGGGHMAVSKVRNVVKPILEQWTNTQNMLVPTSLYGVRVYKTGSVLAPHVDRSPLIISAILNVAQDVEEPWMLEVVAHDGVAHNITMEPGDMVLYESHSVIHGRPFPLKGKYYANVFVHFEPSDKSLYRGSRTADEL